MSKWRITQRQHFGGFTYDVHYRTQIIANGAVDIWYFDLTFGDLANAVKYVRDKSGS